MGWRKAIRVAAVALVLAAIAAMLLAVLSYVAAHRTEPSFAEDAIELPAVVVDRDDPERLGIRGHEDSFRSLAARRLQLGFGMVFLLGSCAALVLVIDLVALGVGAGRRHRRRGETAPDVDAAS